MRTNVIEEAMDVIGRYGGIDGAHHKQWVIDQVARILMGDRYAEWVEAMTTGENAGHDWDEGVAP